MARYFITTNASLPHAAGGISFPFEPVAQRGGSWLGVLALDTPSDADILISAGFPDVDEINESRFDDLKKKQGASQTSSHDSPTRQKPVGLAVAGVVGQSSGHGVSPIDPAKDPNSTANFSAVALMSAEVTPPHEPLLEQQATARKPRPRTK